MARRRKAGGSEKWKGGRLGERETRRFGSAVQQPAVHRFIDSPTHLLTDSPSLRLTTSRRLPSSTSANAKTQHVKSPRLQPRAHRSALSTATRSPFPNFPLSHPPNFLRLAPFRVSHSWCERTASLVAQGPIQHSDKLGDTALRSTARPKSAVATNISAQCAPKLPYSIGRQALEKLQTIAPHRPVPGSQRDSSAKFPRG